MAATRDGWLVADTHASRRSRRAVRRGPAKQPRPGTVLGKKVVKLLHALGCPAWRNNTGVAREAQKDGSIRFVRYGMKGAPDVMGLVPPIGRLIALEVKCGRDVLSEDQQRVLSDFEAAGALTAVVRDNLGGLAELIRAAIDEARAMKRGR